MDESNKPFYFKTSSDFRKWLLKNHKDKSELLVGFYKVSSNRPSMTWSESVDQAICFGWIDGVRKSIDHESYCIRFTPRKPTSIWSAINIKKVEELSANGLMHASGIEIFEKRKEEKSRVYSYEKEAVSLQKEFEKKFKANKAAWKYFQQMPKSYTRPAIHWVMTAKREETKLKRLEELINDSSQGRKIKLLSY
jgi:uncharacterized protein YdeI (YjbR/CyaY-like superfamily)